MAFPRQGFLKSFTPLLRAVGKPAHEKILYRFSNVVHFGRLRTAPFFFLLCLGLRCFNEGYRLCLPLSTNLDVYSPAEENLRGNKNSVASACSNPPN